MGLGKFTGWPFHDLDPRSRLWHWLAKICCLRDKVRTTLPITTKLGSFIVLAMVIKWLDIGEVLLETVILINFLYKFWMCFFKVKHYFGHISGMVGPIDVKRKGSALVGYWVQYVTLTGCLAVREKSGKFQTWQKSGKSQGILLKVREKMNIGKSQGKVREFAFSAV